MQVFRILASAIVLSAAASTAWADVRVTIANGRVTVVAKDATLQQILAEWARVGQTKIVNLERIVGAPMTLELTDVPEAQALDILLRPVTGFMAASRPGDAATVSRFDRIVVMPTMAAPRAPVTAAAMPAPTPTFTPQPPPFPAEDDSEERAAPGARGPVFNTFPQPQVVYPGNPAQTPNVPGVGFVPQYGPNGQPIVVQQPSTTPTASPFGGVAVPGMIVAPPQQPGVVGQPGPLGQPIIVPGQLPPGQTPQPKRPGGQQ
jgi:hypothetical protein